MALFLATSAGCRDDVVLGSLDGTAGGPGPSRIGVGSRVPWGSGEYYLHGANVPWRRYGRDFGTDEGASTAEAGPELDAAFQTARDGGARIVRWFVFVDGTVELPFTTDASGVASGLTPQLYADLDAAIGLAERYDVYLALVIFGDQQPAAAVVEDEAQRRGIVSAIGQMIAYAAPSGRVFSWGLDPQYLPANVRLAFIAELAEAVRARGGGAYFEVTVPSFADLATYCERGVDIAGFVEQGFGERCGHCQTYDDIVRDFDAGCPLAVEIYFADGVALDAMQGYYDRGYAGAFGWSLLPHRTTDGRMFDPVAGAAFAARAGDIGPP